jgi:hypothetical protein
VLVKQGHSCLIAGVQAADKGLFKLWLKYSH